MTCLILCVFTPGVKFCLSVSIVSLASEKLMPNRPCYIQKHELTIQFSPLKQNSLNTDDLLANMKIEVTLKACYLVKCTCIDGKNTVSISILICGTGIYLKFLNVLYESFYIHWG